MSCISRDNGLSGDPELVVADSGSVAMDGLEVAPLGAHDVAAAAVVALVKVIALLVVNVIVLDIGASLDMTRPGTADAVPGVMNFVVTDVLCGQSQRLCTGHQPDVELGAALMHICPPTKQGSSPASGEQPSVEHRPVHGCAPKRAERHVR
jgi:hypothetical protein